MKKQTQFFIWLSIVLMISSFSSCMHPIDAPEKLMLEESAYVSYQNSDQAILAVSQLFSSLQAVSSFSDFLIESIPEEGIPLKVLCHMEIEGEFVPDWIDEKLKAWEMVEAKGVLLAISSAYPNLSISLFHAEGKTGLPHRLPIAPIPSHFQQQEYVEVQLLHTDGSRTTLNNEEEPNQSMLVIENNSSWFSIPIDIEQDAFTEFLSSTTDVDICEEVASTWWKKLSDPSQHGGMLRSENMVWIYRTDLLESLNSCGSAHSVDENPSFVPSDRDTREKREQIVKVQVSPSELSKFCKWWKRDCSIEVKTDFANKTVDNAGNDIGSPVSEPSKFINGRRRDMKNGKIFRCNQDMFQWRYLQGVHGDPYVYNFIGRHHNPGQTTKFSFNFKPEAEFKLLGIPVNLSVLSTKIDHSFTTADAHLGGDWVYYEDDANGDGSMYTTGSISFWVKEKE
ncbi:MAG: hypothetical protein AAFY71_22200 [Bacteroidota bacterium]